MNKILTIVFIMILITLSSWKPKGTYQIHNGFENCYLTFLNSRNFKFEFGGCTHTFKTSGGFVVNKDTITLSFDSFQTMDDDRTKWIDLDPNKVEDNAIVIAEMKYVNKFKKLYRKEGSLIPFGINRPLERKK